MELDCYSDNSYPCIVCPFYGCCGYIRHELGHSNGASPTLILFELIEYLEANVLIDWSQMVTEAIIVGFTLGFLWELHRVVRVIMVALMIICGILVFIFRSSISPPSNGWEWYHYIAYYTVFIVFNFIGREGVIQLKKEFK